MTVFIGKAGGTIHFLPSNKKGKTACGMKHPDMSWTDELNKSSCPQCMRAYPNRGFVRK